jgi:hypothetical protein
MAPPSDETLPSGCFSGFAGGSVGGGGGADDIQNSFLVLNAKRVRVQNQQSQTSDMSNDATVTASGPTAEDKARYETSKKELLQALSAKRATDKQLVCFFLLTSS